MRPTEQENYSRLRLKIWYVVLLLVFAIFITRLFYLQVIKHDYYRKAALSGQFKEYEIPAARGIIEAHDRDSVVPLVLNEKRYTLFADPKHIEDHGDKAQKIVAVIGGNQADYIEKMKASSRYSILAKKLSAEQKDKIETLKLKGIGTREEQYRVYPQGSLASQMLGFVNDEGQGKYGLEQYLDSEIKGIPGQLKAITDASGVPLVSNKDNVIINARPGKKVVLTLDLSMQQQLEEILKKGLENAKSASGSAVIMDPNNGAIKAMANYPSYNPAEFFKIEDPSLFTNPVVSAPLEVGSSMKPLAVAAGLDSGAIQKDSVFNDPAKYVIDGATITNIEEHSGGGRHSISEILQFSLNTGATWVLMQMGGGQINEQARVRWHDYMTNRYQFGKLTGVEQGYEAGGSVPDPKEGFGLNIQFANTTFGQGVSITPLQMAAALSAVVNGGTYYKPHLVEKLVDFEGRETIKQPEVVHGSVVNAETSKTIKEFMEQTVSRNYQAYSMSKPRPQYSIGGKTGTAQINKPGGGYYEDKFNGTFLGFVGGDKPEYIIFVRVNEPKIGGYAGARAAAPIFGTISAMLIDNFSVKPRSQ